MKTLCHLMKLSQEFQARHTSQRIVTRVASARRSVNRMLKSRIWERQYQMIWPDLTVPLGVDRHGHVTSINASFLSFFIPNFLTKKRFSRIKDW